MIGVDGLSLEPCGTQFAIAIGVMAIRIDIDPIDSSAAGEGGVVIRVAGRLAGDAVTHLTEAFRTVEGSVVLDLSKLTFADDAGVEVIQRLQKKGAEISGASSFIKLLINDDLCQT
jgi:anti-anti-sigma regulatory factor